MAIQRKPGCKHKSWMTSKTDWSGTGHMLSIDYDRNISWACDSKYLGGAFTRANSSVSWLGKQTIRKWTFTLERSWQTGPAHNESLSPFSPKGSLIAVHILGGWGDSQVQRKTNRQKLYGQTFTGPTTNKRLLGLWLSKEIFWTQLEARIQPGHIMESGQ